MQVFFNILFKNETNENSNVYCIFAESVVLFYSLYESLKVCYLKQHESDMESATSMTSVHFDMCNTEHHTDLFVKSTTETWHYSSILQYAMFLSKDSLQERHITAIPSHGTQAQTLYGNCTFLWLVSRLK